MENSCGCACIVDRPYIIHKSTLYTCKSFFGPTESMEREGGIEGGGGAIMHGVSVISGLQTVPCARDIPHNFFFCILASMRMYMYMYSVAIYAA